MRIFFFFSMGGLGMLVDVRTIISNHLFADVTFIFCGSNPNDLRYLHCMFLCFEAGLGLTGSSVVTSTLNLTE